MVGLSGTRAALAGFSLVFARGGFFLRISSRPFFGFAAIHWGLREVCWRVVFVVAPSGDGGIGAESSRVV